MRIHFSLSSIFLLCSVAGAAPAAPPASSWHTLDIESLDCRIDVPLTPPGDGRSVQMTGVSRGDSAGSATRGVRIQNYADSELIQGEVPQLRPGQFFLDVRGRRRGRAGGARDDRFLRRAGASIRGAGERRVVRLRPGTAPGGGDDHPHRVALA